MGISQTLRALCLSLPVAQRAAEIAERRAVFDANNDN